MNSVAAVLNDEDDISSENMAQLRSIPSNATGMSETNETDISEEYRNADMLTLENISSQIRYAETFDDVDVKYALSSMRVKEDIVIRQASDITTFAFLIRCEGLTAQKNEDNTVSFIDTSNNEEVFVINAPCMFDAADDFSDRIRIDLEETADGYLMIYTPDTEWLNDAARVYPVTIDPDVSTSRDKLNIYDTYVKEGVNKSPNYDYYTQPSNLVGTYGGKKYRTFLRFANMPHISYDSKINSANLKLYLVSGTNTAQRLSFYKVQRNWTSTNVTWSFATTATNIGYSAYASYTPTKSAGFFSYNPSITGAVRGWYNCNGDRVRNVNGDSYNYGFMIRYANVNENGDYNRIISGENSNTSKRPCITINYTGSVSSGGVTTTTPSKPPRTIADGTYFIRNMNSGKYLDVIGWGSVNKSNVVQYDFTGCTNQQWKITYGTDGYSINYEYTGGRVTKITETASDDTVGESISISYGNKSAVYTDTQGHQEIINFDNYGNQVSVRDELGNAVFSSCDKNSKRRNQLTGTSSILVYCCRRKVNNIAESTKSCRSGRRVNLPCGYKNTGGRNHRTSAQNPARKQYQAGTAKASFQVNFALRKFFHR